MSGEDWFCMGCDCRGLHGHQRRILAPSYRLRVVLAKPYVKRARSPIFSLFIGRQASAAEALRLRDQEAQRKSSKSNLRRALNTFPALDHSTQAQRHAA
jgi:hypothetical protein